MTLKVYAHWVSQPSRAVLWLLRIKAADFEFVFIDFLANATHTADYIDNVSPLESVPAIDDAGFKLGESHAILTYLCEKNGWADVYPSDVKAQALVNQYLHWHHATMRKCTTLLFKPSALAILGGSPLAAEDFESRKKEISKVLTKFESVFLADTPFISSAVYTIADLSAYCEVDQLKATGFLDLTPHKKVCEWVAKMEALPFHTEVHEVLNGLAATLAEKQK